ncbi:hemerythrin domain-containing protein [Aldersonia kunmingensis]|uniref:hemerythrin domain-containing protein n=1 Tax=Aldersonia kunmingensis TaxID=408066 RepID=UPI000829923F|nr:hemerythrin domain-containing protein [Aldersonia kunmingensis]
MTATIDTAARPDTGEMVIVHNTFRRHFSALPGLVRGVADGDVERAQRVVSFVEELSTGLHHHHTTEDEMMWPLLLDRAPTDSALILRMEEQHERIAELNERAQAQAARFAETADWGVREDLAKTLTELSARLDEHMGEEEQHILPVVETVMSVEEWAAMGERGREGIPKDRQLVFLGFILQGVSSQDRKKFLAEMPLIARVMWRLIGKRTYAKEYREIYGTDPDWNS